MQRRRPSRMLRRGRAVIAAWAAATAMFVAPVRPAFAQEEPAEAVSDRERARERYEAGVAAFEQGDYDAALASLEESYALFASLRTLYSIGLCRHAVGDFPASVESLEQYLREGGEEVPEDLRSHAEGLLVEMRRDMASVRIAVNVDGAEVRVDGRTVGTSPLEGPVEVGPGRHVVEAVREGFAGETQRSFVAAGATSVVTLNLQPVAPPPRSGEDGGEGEAEGDGGEGERGPPAGSVAPIVAGLPPEGVSEQEWYGVGDDDYRTYVFETGRRRPLANWILDHNRESEEVTYAEISTGCLGLPLVASGVLMYAFVDPGQSVLEWMPPLEIAVGGALLVGAVFLLIFDGADYGSVDVAHPERLIRVPDDAVTTIAHDRGPRIEATLAPGGLVLRF